jgi:orotate phosphoribosyltransferase
LFSSDFPGREVIAEQTAKMMIEVEAVLFRADDPFKLTSGKYSPVYVDCRKLISYPRVRNTMMDFGASVIKQEVGFESIDGIAGGETAGIPFAAWLADRLFLPMQYIRKKPKGFGRDARIEGDLAEGDRILLVEDLTTDGGSKISFCEGLRDAGAEVTDNFVVFYYDIFPQARKTFDDLGVRLHYLATWWDILAVAKKNNYFDTKTLGVVEAFLNAPVEWQEAHPDG